MDWLRSANTHEHAQGLDARIIDVGPKWVVVRLNSDREVHQLQPDLAHMATCDRTWGTVGITEDPVCGSGNGCVAAFIRELALPGLFPEGHIAGQGMAIGRNGRVRIGYVDATIHVTGQAITVISGHMTLPLTR